MENLIESARLLLEEMTEEEYARFLAVYSSSVLNDFGCDRDNVE